MNSTLSWGSLTGIRPSKIYKELVEVAKASNPNLPEEDVLNIALEDLINSYYVSNSNICI